MSVLEAVKAKQSKAVRYFSPMGIIAIHPFIATPNAAFASRNHRRAGQPYSSSAAVLSGLLATPTD